jgi:hypothetical protein
MQSVPITTNVVSSNTTQARCTWHNIIWELTAKDIEAPIKNDDFIADLRRTGISQSDDCQDRLFRAHGE